MRRAVAMTMGSLLVAGIWLTAGGAASAVQGEPPGAAPLAAAAMEADARGYIVVDRAKGKTVGDRIFYETGPISADTVVIIAEDSTAIPKDASLEQAVAIQSAQAASSGHKTSAIDDIATFATNYAWGAGSSSYSRAFSGQSLVGLDANARATYWFWTMPGTSERASAQGLGYYRGYNGSTFGTWSKWYYVGNAGPTGAGGSVPWGNVAAVEKLRAICTVTVACGGYFN